MKYSLSKSGYIRGVQCLKSLYLNKHFSGERDPMPQARLVRFKAGHNIGLMARTIFPGGVDLTPPHIRQYGVMAERTAELVAAKEAVLYEPAFIYDEVLAALDILVYNDGWYAYEVKSSEGISTTYIEDAALQYYLITSCGIALKDFSIIHLKKNYRQIVGDETAEELFKFTSLLEVCHLKQDEVRSRITTIKYTLASPSVPSITMGDHCNNPYECDFKGFCMKQQGEVREGLFG